MRKNRNPEFAPGVLDGSLDIDLMHPGTDQRSGNRITTGAVSWKQPCPCPVELKLRIFSGQTVRQHHRHAVLLVALPNRSGMVNLLDQFWNQGSRQRHDTVFCTFCGADTEGASFEIDVFDAQVERLRDA